VGIGITVFGSGIYLGEGDFLNEKRIWRANFFRKFKG